MTSKMCGLMLVFALFAPSIATAATVVTVPGGTQVPVQVVEPISSSNANVGDVFQITTAKDIVVNNWIVIPKGSPGQGEVISVDRAGSHGHPGSLGLQVDYVYSADGGKVKLSNISHANQAEGNSGAASTATIASYVVLGPLGLFAHNFVKGKDLTIDSSKTILVFVDYTVHIKATAHPTNDYEH
ncbi:MAG TPA: hypothetical protein VKT51_05500 [Candidatus Eremiobacteraceae bacterium]|nr:hypothetical protein [Candidatus Eremiobacteraceae bacterium]